MSGSKVTIRMPEITERERKRDEEIAETLEWMKRAHHEFMQSLWIPREMLGLPSNKDDT